MKKKTKTFKDFIRDLVYNNPRADRQSGSWMGKMKNGFLSICCMTLKQRSEFLRGLYAISRHLIIALTHSYNWKVIFNNFPKDDLQRQPKTRSLVNLI